MKEWETDFQARADALRASSKDGLPVCNQVGGFTIYERQMIEVDLDSLPKHTAMFVYLAVVPGSSASDWAPAVLDVFFGEREAFSHGWYLSRSTVKVMISSVPAKDQWGLLIGLETPHILTYHNQNYRFNRTDIYMNDEGDMKMMFSVCLEEKSKVSIKH